MAVLISGASGFLGRQLVDRLAASGTEVIALSRQPCDLWRDTIHNIRCVYCDIAGEGIDVDKLPDDIEVVVHLAGATLGAGKDERVFLEANEQTTVRLLQALADRADYFVFASSQVVYGNAQHLSVTEDFPLIPDGSAYACSKINSENWLRWFQHRYGGQYMALRFCGFIDGGGIIDYLIDCALVDVPIELYSHGRVHRDYLPSSEGVDVLLAALKYRGEAGFIPVNVGSGQAVSVQELATLVCDELKSSSRIELNGTPAPQGDFVFCIDRARELFDFHPGDLIDAVRHHALYRRDLAFKQVGDEKN